MTHPAAVVIVPAGGTGTRMGGDRPKQYLLLGGKPILARTLARLQSSDAVAAIVLVIREEDRQVCADLGLEKAFGKIRALVAGGSERWQSVRAGLAYTSAEDPVILVHDGVRPFVTHELLLRVARCAWEYGAAVPALPVRETIKEVRGGLVRRTPDRSALWTVQTPQGFRRDVLLEAYGAAEGSMGATDDAMLVEQSGHPVQVVEGEYGNIKITTPEDMEWAEWQLSGGTRMDLAGMRIGHGVDVHAFAPGRDLVLGGVRIPFEVGLAGHSDADVLTHAIIDALLGAAGCGDIGRLFPDTDSRYAGISSLVLLERTCALLAQRGAIPVNIDTVVIAQRPRIDVHVSEMRQALGRTMGIPPERISIKGTTTEGMGFVGRQEGMAAQAIALVRV